MARPALATRETVFAEADRLLSQGVEPTLALIRKATGGSFSSVQVLFTEWKQEQAQTTTHVVPLPPDLEARGMQLVRSVWQAACAAAEGQVLAAQTAATQAIADAVAATAEVTEALQEQEAINEAQGAALATMQETLAQLRHERDQAYHAEQIAHAQREDLLRRVTEATDQRAAAERERDAAHAAARDAEIVVARQAGELAALREQIAGLLGRLTPVRNDDDLP